MLLDEALKHMKETEYPESIQVSQSATYMKKQSFLVKIVI